MLQCQNVSGKITPLAAFKVTIIAKENGGIFWHRKYSVH
jgi:hypothetical protein